MTTSKNIFRDYLKYTTNASENSKKIKLYPKTLSEWLITILVPFVADCKGRLILKSNYKLDNYWNI